MKLEYRTKRYWYNLILTPLFVTLLTYIYLEKIIVFDINDLTSVFWIFLLSLFGIIGIKDFFHMVFGSLKIEVRNRELFIEYHNGFYTKKQGFELRKIENLEIDYNIANGYSWNFGGLIFGDTDNQILKFKYNGKKKIIGKRINEFDANVLMKKIVEIKN
ncbi:hypothetical protein [uncultured Maribacter sp.]|uniref:hypothetical protein n=1 Tax=uncultured Maribacter sp. TaxID=431308 RepID=UPI00262D0DE5|nr:hypothetical protein [uncultured Maribacter sp.]